jgi:ADP-ribose pyrophosphatase YjhB (NUDIX family)
MNYQADPQWLTWTKRLQAIAQNGLTYARDPFDTERYEQLQQVAAEMMAAGTGIANSEKVLDLFRQEHGYATPKIEVRGAAFRDGEVLLVRERDDGGWTVPGGWADLGDPPSAMVAREVKEESGFDVVARKLAAVYDRNRHPHPPSPNHAYKMMFICELMGGEAKPSYETPEVAFFARNRLPTLSIARITAYQMEQLFEHAAHPEWPTVFD